MAASFDKTSLLRITLRKVKKFKKKSKAFLIRQVLINNTLICMRRRNKERVRQSDLLKLMKSVECDSSDETECEPRISEKQEKFRCLKLPIGGELSCKKDPDNHKVPLIESNGDPEFELEEMGEEI